MVQIGYLPMNLLFQVYKNVFKTWILWLFCKKIQINTKYLNKFHKK